jgi:hypothetical protein
MVEDTRFDPRHSALDASHALVLAVHEATRFRQGAEAGGLVGRLRDLAAEAASAVVRACREAPGAPAGLRQPLALLRQLDRDLAQARATGLVDRPGARLISDLESRARHALRICAERDPPRPVG